MYIWLLEYEMAGDFEGDAPRRIIKLAKTQKKGTSLALELLSNERWEFRGKPLKPFEEYEGELKEKLPTGTWWWLDNNAHFTLTEIEVEE